MASRLERLVSIDAYVRAGHYPSVQKLCDMFEVQPRTIYQDLRELREMFGLDIRFDRHRNGYFNADPSKQLPPLAMTYEEALLITLAIEMLATSLGPTFRGALTRASEMVRASDHKRFSWVRDLVHLEDRANCQVKCSVLIPLLKAATNGQEATLILSEGKRRHLAVMPTKILYANGHWQVVSRTHTNGNGRRKRGAEDDFDGPLPPGHTATRLCVVTDVQIGDASED